MSPAVRLSKPKFLIITFPFGYFNQAAVKIHGQKKRKSNLLVKDMIAQLIPQQKARPLNYVMGKKGKQSGLGDRCGGNPA